MAISAKLVQELRQKTNAGMMDCKKALEEADGDMDKAIEVLRTRGIAKAESRAGREANEGLIVSYIHAGSKLGVMLEVNSETDSPNNSDIPAEIYNVTVEKLELSCRTLNCLKRAGINKVGEVLERTAAELLKIRNFGDKSLDELRARLEENDLPVPDSFLGRSDAPEESESVAEDAGQAAEAEGAGEEESVTEFPKED